MPHSPLALRTANQPPGRWASGRYVAMPWRGMRRVTRSWMLLIGGFYLAGTAEALATCGDWLAHPVARHDAAAATDGAPDATPATEITSIDRTPPPGERRSPCQGPGCRSLPETPVSPPPPPNSPSDDQQACTGRVVGASSPLSGVFCSGPSVAPRAGFYPRLEDPPRRPPGIGASTSDRGCNAA